MRGVRAMPGRDDGSLWRQGLFWRGPEDLKGAVAEAMNHRGPALVNIVLSLRTREASNPNDANEAGWARISLRCASMRRKIALNRPGIWGMSVKMAPQLVSRVSPGLQA
jgi:hypothetical protein